MAYKKKTKHATLNGCISKARANSGFKLTFSESLLSFLQNSVVFACFTHVDTRQGAPHPTTPGAAAGGSLKELIMIQ